MNERDLEELLPHALAAPDAGRCAREAELARYAAGEMDPAERAAFEPHLADCADCRTDLAALGPARRVWDEAVPERRAGWRWRLPALAAGLVGVAAALLVLVRPPDEPRLVAKGSWQLLVAVQRGGEVFRAYEGVELREGDRLGFFYTAEEPGYLHVLYADEAEAVVLHPTGDQVPQPSPAGTEVRVPDGAEVRAGHGCEWVVGFFTREPLGAQRATAAVQKMVRGRKECRLGAGDVEGAQVLGVRR